MSRSQAFFSVGIVMIDARLSLQSFTFSSSEAPSHIFASFIQSCMQRRKRERA